MSETQFERFHYDYQNAAESEKNAAANKENLSIIAALGLKPFTDGDMYCFLWGDDLQNGIAGFGETVDLAVLDFNKNYFKKSHRR